MKKLLFASTALVATAGVASAQDLGVALTGAAEMGIYNPNTEEAETQFFTDLDVTFTMTGETDNGISFGATIDLDEAADFNNPGAFENPNTQGGENMFVSFGGATLTMGDTDGALDARVPEMNLASSSLADDETVHAGFDDGTWLDSNEDGQIARFDYTYSAFTFSLSAEQENDGSDIDDDPLTPLIDESDDSNTIWGVGVSYAGDFNGIAIDTGLAYQDQEDTGSVTSLAATAGFANGLSVGATTSKFDPDASGVDEITHWGLGVGYEMNAIAVGLNYGKFEQDDEEQSGYGLAASYDFGGGMTANLGYGNNELVGDDDFDTWSLGVRMSF